MSLDRQKARGVLAGYGFHLASDLGILDRLAECVTPPPILVHSEEEFRARADAEGHVAAVLALHQPHTLNLERDSCDECGDGYPCATARACGVTE